MAKTCVPAEALWFRAGIKFQAGEENKTRQFEGVAYSGQALSHCFWERVAFDLSSTFFGEKIPALVDHDRGSRAGVASLSNKDNQLLAKGNLLSNTHGQAVASDADEGFPWQMSVHIEPGSIEWFEPGQEVTINGHPLTGPLHVFRNNQIREVSFTPTGIDSDTTARVMSSGQEISVELKEHAMSEKKEGELQAQLADLQKQVTSLQAGIDKEKERANEAEKSLADFKKQNRESEIAALEKTTGKQFSKEDKDLMLGMDEKAFQFMAGQMKQAKPDLPEEMFSHPGNQGATQTSNPLLEDAEKRYAS